MAQAALKGADVAISESLDTLRDHSSANPGHFLSRRDLVYREIELAPLLEKMRTSNALLDDGATFCEIASELSDRGLEAGIKRLARELKSLETSLTSVRRGIEGKSVSSSPFAVARAIHNDMGVEIAAFNAGISRVTLSACYLQILGNAAADLMGPEVSGAHLLSPQVSAATPSRRQV